LSCAPLAASFQLLAAGNMPYLHRNPCKLCILLKIND